MNDSRKLIAGLFILIALLSGCSDDESGFKEEIELKGGYLKTYTQSFRKAKVYLTQEDIYGSHTYRSYIISDGTFNWDAVTEGWDIEHFDNATYALYISIGVPQGESLAAGEYPVVQEFEAAGENEQFGYIYYEANPNENTRLDVNTGEGDGSPIVVTGDIEDGGVITIKYQGELLRYIQINNEFGQESTQAKISFRGRVQDVRVAE